MNNKLSKKLKLNITTPLTLALGALISSSNASIINSTNGTFSITESFDSSFGIVEYRFDLLAGADDVHVVAISYVEDFTAVAVAVGNEFALSENWNSILATEDEWNNGLSFTLSSLKPAIAGAMINTASIGGFDEIFGTSDNRVAIYYNDSDAPLDESSDADPGDASFSDATFTRELGLPASEVIALGINGNVIGGSVIPEPSSSLLIAASAFGFVVRRNRKHQIAS